LFSTTPRPKDVISTTQQPSEESIAPAASSEPNAPLSLREKQTDNSFLKRFNTRGTVSWLLGYTGFLVLLLALGQSRNPVFWVAAWAGGASFGRHEEEIWRLVVSILGILLLVNIGGTIGLWFLRRFWWQLLAPFMLMINTYLTVVLSHVFTASGVEPMVITLVWVVAGVLVLMQVITILRICKGSAVQGTLAASSAGETG